MERLLTGFVRALRAAGADASTAETLDAARAMALVGYADRQTLKTSLGLVLAKSAEEKTLHDAVFERYFSRPDCAAPSSDGAAPAQPRTGQAEVDALLDLAAGAAADGAGPSALDQALARAASAAGVDDIQFASQAAYFTRRMLDALGTAALEARLMARLAEAERGASPGAAGGPGSVDHAAAQAEATLLARARSQLQRRARAWVQQRFELFGRPATEAFLADVVVHRAIGRMAPADMDRMKAAVARMAKRLAAKHSRRQRRLLRGQLDLRHTLRANAGHDGVPFSLAFKHKRRDKPRIVVVCDVSGSVAAHVRFLLLFLYALHDVVSDLRSFAFSNRLKDVTAPLETLPFDEAIALILKDVGGGSTDYGQAWVDLQNKHGDVVTRQTTVLVLGDGRGNHSDPRTDLFAGLAQRAKRLIWLCPEPAWRWGSGDSAMLQYQPFCSHVSHCASAADIERAIDEALLA